MSNDFLPQSRGNLLRFWGGLFCLMVLSALPSAVHAHAELVSSFPPPGATYTALDTATLTFNEPIGEGSQLALVDADFRRTELTVTWENETISAAVPVLDPGNYTLEFDVVSADGHTILGSIQFAIAAQPVNPIAQIALLAIGALVGFGLLRLWHNRRRQKWNALP